MSWDIDFAADPSCSFLPALHLLKDSDQTCMYVYIIVKEKGINFGDLDPILKVTEVTI